MNYAKLNQIKKLYFGYEEISKVLGISIGSARVSATRFVKYGFLVRIKRNIYMLKERWNGLGGEEIFAIANLIEVPSYVSLMTALSYYQITTLLQRDFVESISVVRTKKLEVEKAFFRYNKIDKRLYFGFQRVNDFFIATAEKAFVDAAYLASLKRYSFDMTSIDFAKLDKGNLKDILKRFPERTNDFLKAYGYFKKS